MDQSTRNRIEASFARQGLMKTFGARIAHLEPGVAHVEAEVTEASSQQKGMGHAGLTFALADSAAGYAALTLMDESTEVVTSEFRISLLAPATGRLIAEGRVIRPGRRLIAVAADVWCGAAGARVHVAAALGTMVPVAA